MSAMKATASPASARLERLAGYLQQDPDNLALLAETCDAALACGHHAQVESCIAAAERLAPQAAEWKFRQAQLHIARRELGDARGLLEALRAELGEHPAVLHDLAYVHLLLGDAERAHDLLQAGAADDFHASGIADEQAGLLQSLWLRACHHAGMLQEAWDWIARARTAQRLLPDAAGVASLVALDLGHMDLAGELAREALRARPTHREALLALGSLALAQGEPVQAGAHLQQALEHHGEDGRTLSALGLASLLQGELPLARERLEKAVEAMPNHVHSWQALGWTRMLAGDRGGALAAFEEALRRDSDAADSHATVGLAQALLGDRAAASHHLERADALDAGDGTAQLAHAAMRGRLAPGDMQAWMQRLVAQWRPRP